MRLLAYGILRDRESAPLPDLTATGGPALARISVDGLAIAYSRVSPEDAAPDLAHLQAYAQVVEALHHLDTILPLRYGCMLGAKAELESLLRRNRQAWLAALDEVEGCEEMGLRVLLQADGASHRPAPPVPPPTPRLLGGRLSHRPPGPVRRADALGEEAARIVGRVQQALPALYRRCHVEGPGAAQNSILSLAFLVPRGSRTLPTRVRAPSGDEPGSNAPDRSLAPLSLHRSGVKHQQMTFPASGSVPSSVLLAASKVR